MRLTFKRWVAILGVFCGGASAALAQAPYPVTTIHTLHGNEGNYPESPLIQAMDGNFYGTTSTGGDTADGAYAGTIYRLTAAGEFTNLHDFNFRDGAFPSTPLIEYSGYFYGATSNGGPEYEREGPAVSMGYGTIFRIGPDGRLKTLVNCDYTTRFPSSLVLGRDGNFYGTTSVRTGGIVFRMTPDGTLTVLHSCMQRLGSLLVAQDGDLYGTVTGGGAHKAGTVFHISTSGAFTSLYSFTAAVGQEPRLQFQGADGAFYGIIGMIYNQPSGTVFRVSRTGEYSIVHTFTFPHYASASAVLIQGQDGNFYGTAGQTNITHIDRTLEVDHTHYTIYQLTPGGIVTRLRDFVNARIPTTLLQGSDGDLYSTCVNGSILRLGLTQ